MANTPTEITSIADKSTLKNWFKTGLKPLQNHFWLWLDSYWHKSESIPINSIEGLAGAIDNKAPNNHTHSEYATNDASSLTEDDVLSWKEALDVANLQFDDEAISITQPYPFYGLNGDEKQADYNIANYEAVQKRLEKPLTESDTTDHPFVVAVDEDGESAMIPATEFGKVDTVMGVAADANKNVDISGEAMNWTNASHRFSALSDKSADATYNQFAVFDSNGNFSKVTNAFNVLKNSLNTMTQAQALELGQLFNAGQGSGVAIKINSFSPPIFELNNHSTTIIVSGNGLDLNVTDFAIHLLDESGNYIRDIPNSNVTFLTTNQLKIRENFFADGVGDYKLKIISGVKQYVSTTSFKIVNEVENIDTSLIVWDKIVNTDIVTEDESFGSGSVFQLKPNVDVAHTSPIVSLLTNDLFASDDDFYMEIQVNTGMADIGGSDVFRMGICYGTVNNDLVYLPIHYWAYRKVGANQRVQTKVNPNSFFPRANGTSMSSQSYVISISKIGNEVIIDDGVQIGVVTISTNTSYKLSAQILGVKIQNNNKEETSGQILKAYKIIKI